MSVVTDDARAVETPDPRPRWTHPFVVVAAVLALLLIGATGGLLVGRAGESAVQGAGSVDVGFLQDMSVHHAQAVTMAGWERDHTTDPQLEQLAFDIESTQNAQVGRMQGWLELWGQDDQPVGRAYMTWMTGDMAGTSTGAGGAAVMPGMASDTDLKNLRAASGPKLDVLFLQLMLRHHRGGSSMLSDAAQNASRLEVRNLATQILSSQQTEAEYMTQLLTARGGTPLPA